METGTASRAAPGTPSEHWRSEHASVQVTAQLQGRESQQRGWQAGGVHGRRVGALVLVEVVLSAEPLAAELAAERPVTRVNARVTGELLVPGEPLVARVALEWTLACKREHRRYDTASDDQFAIGLRRKLGQHPTQCIRSNQYHT